MNGGKGHVHGVELIVTGRRRDHPTAAAHHSGHAELLLPDGDRLADSLPLAEQILTGYRSENHDLIGLCLLTLGIEPALGKDPRAPNFGQREVVAVNPREPALLARQYVNILMDAFGNELHTGQLSDGAGVTVAQRPGCPQSAFRASHPLPGQWVVMLFERIAFVGYERE